METEAGVGPVSHFLFLLVLVPLLSAPGCDAPRPEEVRPVFDDPEAFSGLSEEPRASASSEFWNRWGDGRAELSGYRLHQRRYGEMREGEIVLVYVTEPHDRRSWIKDDRAEAPHRVEVLKLLSHREFDTGIYPYTATTAVFAPVDQWGPERFAPVKMTAGVQEWCGIWQGALWPGEGRFRVLRLSYFAAEGERRAERNVPEGTLYEDALLIQLRELDGPFAGGGDWEGSAVPSLWSLRTGHGPAEAVPATISRTEALREDVPVTRFTLRYGDRVLRYDVERDDRRRVLGWTVEADGREEERAELLGTTRLPYWELNRRGDEVMRIELGLPVRRQPAPAPGSPDPPRASPPTPGNPGPAPRVQEYERTDGVP